MYMLSTLSFSNAIKKIVITIENVTLAKFVFLSIIKKWPYAKIFYKNLIETRYCV